MRSRNRVEGSTAMLFGIRVTMGSIDCVLLCHSCRWSSSSIGNSDVHAWSSDKVFCSTITWNKKSQPSVSQLPSHPSSPHSSPHKHSTAQQRGGGRQPVELLKAGYSQAEHKSRLLLEHLKGPIPYMLSARWRNFYSPAVHEHVSGTSEVLNPHNYSP